MAGTSYRSKTVAINVSVSNMKDRGQNEANKEVWGGGEWKGDDKLATLIYRLV